MWITIACLFVPLLLICPAVLCFNIVITNGQGVETVTKVYGVDTEVQLQCPLQLDGYKIEWSYLKMYEDGTVESKRIIGYNTLKNKVYPLYYDKTKYSVTEDTKGNFTVLVIYNLTPNDSKQYKCEIKGGHGALHHYIKLEVLAGEFQKSEKDVQLPPQILVQPEENIIYVNDDVKLLECEAKGVPTVEFYWKKNGADFDLNRPNIEVIGAGTGSFKFKPATSLDEGYYQCFAKNYYGIALSKVAAMKRGVLDAYKPTNKVTDYGVIIGDKLKVECLYTKSFPTVEYTWNIANSLEDSTLIPVVLGKRIQQDMDGNLYFSNIESGDNQNDKIYKCSVYNPYMKLTTTGSYSKITVDSTTPTASAPSVVYSTPVPVIGLVGREVVLKCIFAGYPTPSVRWFRIVSGNQIALPAGRTEYKEYDTKMILKELILNDEGVYRCQGYYNDMYENVDTRMIVQEIPRFTQPDKQPYNINKTVGEPVSFFCDASGIPTPGVQWYRNGKPIDAVSPGPRITVSKDHKNLTVHNVCKDCGNGETDLMVIQCNSSNDHGYAYSEGYLNVLLRTVLVTKPESVHMVNLDDEVFFACEATSDDSTPVFITWQLNGTEIDQSAPEYEVLPSGLKVTPNKKENPGEAAGTYTCTASNGLSVDFAVATLTVPDVPDDEKDNCDNTLVIILATALGGVVLFLVILVILSAVLYLLDFRCKRKHTCSTNQKSEVPSNIGVVKHRILAEEVIQSDTDLEHKFQEADQHADLDPENLPIPVKEYNIDKDSKVYYNCPNPVDSAYEDLLTRRDNDQYANTKDIKIYQDLNK